MLNRGEKRGETYITIHIHIQKLTNRKIINILLIVDCRHFIWSPWNAWPQEILILFLNVFFLFSFCEWIYYNSFYIVFYSVISAFFGQLLWIKKTDRVTHIYNSQFNLIIFFSYFSCWMFIRLCCHQTEFRSA